MKKKWRILSLFLLLLLLVLGFIGYNPNFFEKPQEPANHDILSKIIYDKNPKSIIAVGPWTNDTALHMAKKMPNDAKLFILNPITISKNYEAEKVALENMEYNKLVTYLSKNNIKNIHPIKANEGNFLDIINSLKPDLIYFENDWTHEEFLNELNLWLPIINENAQVCGGHISLPEDPSNMPSTFKVVHDFTEKHHLYHSTYNNLNYWWGDVYTLWSISNKPSPKSLEWMFDDEYQIKLANDKKSQSFDKFGKILFNLSNEARNAKRKLLYAKSKEIFLNLNNEAGNRIPYITHRMWLTNPKKPYEASPENIALYLKSLKSLNSSKNWRHIFWCADPEKIPKTIETLTNSGMNIEIHTISEIYPKMYGKHLFDRLFQNNLFALAGNIARQNVVFQFGGIYADIGTLFNEDFTPYLDAYDYIFQASKIFADQSVIAFKANDPIIGTYLKNIDILYKLPEKYKRLTPDTRSHTQWVRPQHFFTVFEALSKKDERVLFVPEAAQGLLIIDHNRSWLRKSYGNKFSEGSSLDFFSVLPD